MKGDDKLIGMLNELLAHELTAMDQYFVHSEMYKDFGLSKLYERIAHEFDDEKGHAQLLIERILFLGGTPDIVTRLPVNIGNDVPAMLQSDLDIEYAVGQKLKEAMAYSESIDDFVTRSMLESLLDDTESDHTYWLEQQLGLIKRIGIQNYLQSNI